MNIVDRQRSREVRGADVRCSASRERRNMRDNSELQVVLAAATEMFDRAFRKGAIAILEIRHTVMVQTLIAGAKLRTRPWIDSAFDEAGDEIDELCNRLERKYTARCWIDGTEVPIVGFDLDAVIFGHEYCNLPQFVVSL